MKKCSGLTIGLLLVAACALADAHGGHIELSRDMQKQLDLTVYNDFAVVRDVREAALPRGIVDVDYLDVAKTIDPTSVRVTSIGREELFSVEQQTYQYDLLNRQSLLQCYIGRKLKYSRSVKSGDTYERELREGTLLAIDPEIVRFGDEVEISPRGVISLPAIPEGLRTVPTLIWRVDNRVRGKQSIATSYLANGLSWSTDYRLDLSEDETEGDLSVWVSVRNESGIDYPGADIQLVAGDVKRAAAPRPRVSAPRAALMRAEPHVITGEPFFEYYMYHMPGPVDLENNETKQFRLMSAQDIPVSESYVLTTAVPEQQLQQKLTDRFDVRLTFDNRAKFGLGIPLPSGRFRVFKFGNQGAPQLLGEDRLAHKSRGQSATVSVGKAFDLIAEHSQTAYRRVGDRGMEVSYRVDLHNHKQQKVTVTLDEKFNGDWTITSQTAHGKHVDSATQEYVLTLGANTDQSFDFTARINY